MNTAYSSECKISVLWIFQAVRQTTGKRTKNRNRTCKRIFIDLCHSLVFTRCVNLSGMDKQTIRKFLISQLLLLTLGHNVLVVKHLEAIVPLVKFTANTQVKMPMMATRAVLALATLGGMEPVGSLHSRMPVACTIEVLQS